VVEYRVVQLAGDDDPNSALRWLVYGATPLSDRVGLIYAQSKTYYKAIGAVVGTTVQFYGSKSASDVTAFSTNLAGYVDLNAAGSPRRPRRRTAR
jgi:hypothetical protein